MITTLLFTLALSAAPKLELEPAVSWVTGTVERVEDGWVTLCVPVDAKQAADLQRLGFKKLTGKSACFEYRIQENNPSAAKVTAAAGKLVKLAVRRSTRGGMYIVETRLSGP